MDTRHRCSNLGTQWSTLPAKDFKESSTVCTRLQPQRIMQLSRHRRRKAHAHQILNNAHLTRGVRLWVGVEVHPILKSWESATLTKIPGMLNDAETIWKRFLTLSNLHTLASTGACVVADSAKNFFPQVKCSCHSRPLSLRSAFVNRKWDNHNVAETHLAG